MSAFIHVPAREGRGAHLASGTRFRVVDIEGRQAVDLFAYCADDIGEYVSAEHTRVHINRLFPHPGEHFVTNKRRPLLYFERDNSPGIHDLLIAACDPARYAGLGVSGWHASCQENLQTVMAGFGYDRIEIPQPINLFTNIPVTADGTLHWEVGLSGPGDSVTFRVERDSYVVVSSCPQDIIAINDNRPTPIGLEISGIEMPHV